MQRRVGVVCLVGGGAQTQAPLLFRPPSCPRSTPALPPARARLPTSPPPAGPTCLFPPQSRACALSNESPRPFNVPGLLVCAPVALASPRSSCPRALSSVSTTSACTPLRSPRYHAALAHPPPPSPLPRARRFGLLVVFLVLARPPRSPRPPRAHRFDLCAVFLPSCTLHDFLQLRAPAASTSTPSSCPHAAFSATPTLARPSLPSQNQLSGASCPSNLQVASCDKIL